MRGRIAAFVIVAGSAAASASPAHAAVYGGTSGNENAFVLVTEGRTLEVAAVWVDAQCDDGAGLTYSAPIEFAAQQPSVLPEGENVMSGNRVGANGRFTAKGGGTSDYGENIGQVTQTISGRVTRRSARGTLSMEVKLVNRATQQPVTTCRSGPVSWRARSAPRRIFGGITSFGNPVVAILSSNRRTVRNLYVGWSASCQPPGNFSISDALVNFRISRTGRFGDEFEGKFPIEGGGGERTYEYDLSGRIRGTRLTGSVGVTVTDRNPGGQVASTCKRAKHRFIATSTAAR